MKSNVILTNETRLYVAALLPIVMLTSVTILVGIILASSTVFADNDSVVDEVNITVPVSCTMSGTGMNTHNAEINNGTYVGSVETDAGTGETIAHGIGRTNVHAFCNDNEGFAIYAAGYTGNEVGGANSNKLVGTAASNYTTIATGTAVGPVGGNDISNWAMAITPVSDSGDTSPTNAFTIDSDASGSFSMFHAVPNEYTKVAHKNSGTDMTDTTGGIKFDTTYAAYISKIQPADTYSGQAIYTLVHPADAAAPTVPKSLDTATTMQEVTYCSEDLPEGQVYTLTDERDGNTYHVARLKDGNCWMLDNLALDPTDPATAANMNASNTNATQEAITNLLNGGSSTTGWSNTAVANVTTNFTNNDSFIQPRINNASKDTLVVSYGPASTNGQAKVGIYYNFCAASASTYCYAYGQGVDVPDTIIDAPQDICPANWRMPTSGSNTGEYATLAKKYTNTATETNSLQYNLSTPLSGFYQGDDVSNNQGSCGDWWSSTYLSSYYMYSLYAYPTYVYPYYSTRYSGLSMRCLMSD